MNTGTQDNLLKARIKDLAAQCGRAQRITLTGFLSPAELATARQAAKTASPRFISSGGYADAERQILVFLPDYLADSEPDWNEFIHVLKLVPAQEGLTHRDYLGAILALGIRRDQIGDILVGSRAAQIILLAGISSFIAGQLERVGATGVTITRETLADLTVPDRDWITSQGNVASLRLDNVAAEGFSLPRAEIAEMIRSGRVQLNWVIEQRPDHMIQPGDMISLRGYGRLRLVDVGGQSRKGRYFITTEKSS